MPAPDRPDTLTITAHCLLRYTIGLSLEAAFLDHGEACVTDELNQLSGRQLDAAAWLKIIEPYYLERFAPTPGELAAAPAPPPAARSAAG